MSSMSSISVSNILPTRTRSGRPWNHVDSGPWNHLDEGRSWTPEDRSWTPEDRSWTPEDRSWTPERRTVPVMPTTPTKPRARVNRQALDVLCRAAIYLNLLDDAKELYRLQIEYIKDVKGGEKKRELLKLYHDLTVKVHELIRLNEKNATLQEIENYSELVGWVSRMSVFNQMVAVL